MLEKYIVSMVLLSFFCAAQEAEATGNESEKISESKDKEIQEEDIPDNMIFFKDSLDNYFVLSNSDCAVFNGGQWAKSLVPIKEISPLNTKIINIEYGMGYGSIKATELYHLLQTNLRKIEIQRWDIGHFLSVVGKTKSGNNGELRQKNSFCLKDLTLYEVPVEEDDFQEISTLCKKLEKLQIQHASLTRIPTEFSRLHHMQALFLPQNKIASIEALGFADFPNLRSIDLEDNNVRSLKPLAKMSSTQKVSFWIKGTTLPALENLRRTG